MHARRLVPRHFGLVVFPLCVVAIAALLATGTAARAQGACDDRCGDATPVDGCRCDEEGIAQGLSCEGIRASCNVPWLDMAPAWTGPNRLRLYGENLRGNASGQHPIVSVGGVPCTIGSGSTDKLLYCSIDGDAVPGLPSVDMRVTWSDVRDGQSVLEQVRVVQSNWYGVPRPQLLYVDRMGNDLRALRRGDRIALVGLRHLGDAPRVALDRFAPLTDQVHPINIRGKSVLLDPIITTTEDGTRLEIEVPYLYGDEHVLQISNGETLSSALYILAAPPEVTAVTRTRIARQDGELVDRIVVRGEHIHPPLDMRAPTGGLEYGPSVLTDIGTRCYITDIEDDGALVCETEAPIDLPFYVRVVNVNGTSAPFPVGFPVPEIDTVAPLVWSPAGDLVVVEGRWLGESTVLLDGAPLTLVTRGANELVAVIPAGLGDGYTLTLVDVLGGTYPLGTGRYAAPEATGLSSTIVRAGDVVTLSGASFGTDEGELWVGTARADIRAWGDTTIVFVVPVGSGLDVPVVVEAGSQASDPILVDYAAPELQTMSTAVMPADAPSRTLVLTGRGFGTSGRVALGATGAITCEANAPASWTDTRISCVVPSLPAGRHDVVVIAQGQSSNALSLATSGLFASLSPTHGPATGGTAVVIRGSGLATLTSITIGGVPAQVVNQTDGEATIITPPGTGLGNVVVGRVGSEVVTNTLYFDRDRPVVTAWSAPSGATTASAGTVITLTGTGLAGSRITIGDAQATVLAPGETSLQVVVPVGQGSAAPLVAHVGELGSEPIPFAYPEPELDTIAAPLSTAGGELLLTGRHFGLHPRFVLTGGPTLEVVSSSDTSARVLVPAGVGVGELTALAGDQSSAPVVLARRAPQVDALSTLVVRAGETVAIDGAELGSSGATVWVGEREARVLTQDHTRITFQVPVGGGVDRPVLVRVGGLEDPADPPLVDYAPPAPLAVSPARISPLVPTEITIVGTGFGDGGASVDLGGGPCSVRAVTDRAITCLAPAGAGPISVTVIANGQSSGPVSDLVAYRPPRLDGMTTSEPDADYPVVSTAGGPVVLSGDDFAASATVLVDDAQVPVVERSATSLVVNMPSGVGAGHVIQVVQGGQRSAALLFDRTRPTVTAASPGLVTSGSILTISGTDFGDQGTVTVYVGGRVCGSPQRTSTTITCVVPPGGGIAEEVTVDIAGQASRAGVLGPVLVTYLDPIELAALCPCDGPRGGDTPWPDHAAYVACVDLALDDATELAGLDAEALEAMAAFAAAGTCGEDPCHDTRLERARAGATRPEVLLQLEDFAGFGDGAPSAARVYLGDRLLAPIDGDVYVVPLFDEAGRVVRDGRPRVTSPTGALRVTRDGRGGVSVELGPVRRGARVAVEARLEVVDGRRGRERAVGLEGQGDGAATWGNPLQDELWVLIDAVRVSMTATQDRDAIDFAVCR